MENTDLNDARLALKKFFGYDAFRPMQADIIQEVYKRRDAVVLMPTGGGKSICYQVPAVTLDGVTVVVSPLIALMKDQVEGLRANGVPAAFINSTQDSRQMRAVEDAVIAGQTKILYVSPEKLVSQGFQPLLKRLKISLFAIDEAHCISSWGHDFRPEYTQLQFLKLQFPDIPILALTATADKLTRRDIIQQLNLQDPKVFLASFDRPNISLTVRPGLKRFEQIIDFLKTRSGESGIIYCLARKTCVELAEKLVARGIRAAPYHAELPPGLRSQIQEDFINDRTPVVCATIAFGMGIDKSNVRYVIHYNLPRNLEGYYQEIGRGGRDGLPAEALLFFSYGDVTTYRKMIWESEADQVQKDLKMAKLDRMYEFAEAPICRRKMVLSYFGEAYDRNCGNCDVCKNPPQQFDGTIAVQKALSALLRTEERVGMNLLVEILRGSNRREVLEQGFNKIKTYGAGREYSYEEWMFLLSQMLHLGIIEIAYEEHGHLRATEAGKAILFEGKQVALPLPQKKEKKAAPEAKIAAERPKARSQQLREDLFRILVDLRRAVAQEVGTPPYLIFSDATLEDMAEKRPITDGDLLDVTGVGERKLQLYGDRFLATIRKFILERVESGWSVVGSTFLVTWELYKQGKSVEQIAQERGISTMAVMNHLATIYERGEDFDLRNWVSREQLDLVQGALPLFEQPYQLKAIFEHFEERLSYDAIRWAVADFRRKKVDAA